MTQDELRKEFEATFPIPENVKWNTQEGFYMGQYDKRIKDLAVGVDAAINFNATWLGWRVAALKRDAEIARLQSEANELITHNTLLGAGIAKLNVKIAALKAELEMAKIKHYRECAVIAKSCQSGLGAANFIDAAMQSGTTESPPSSA